MGGLISMGVIFFFKQKTAYEMRISDWSSDVCSSDLGRTQARRIARRSARRADGLPDPVRRLSTRLPDLPDRFRAEGRAGRMIASISLKWGPRHTPPFAEH